MKQTEEGIIVFDCAPSLHFCFPVALVIKPLTTHTCSRWISTVERKSFTFCTLYEKRVQYSVNQLY